MLVPGSVNILDTCHASLPPYKCWEGAALLLKHFPDDAPPTCDGSPERLLDQRCCWCHYQ